MRTIIRDFVIKNGILNFNQVNRDLWIADQARLIPKGSSILDIGAGSCPYRHLFSHCDYRSQDAKGLAPEQLRDKFGYGQIDYLCDATNIPVNDGSFDAVLCTEVLEHVPEPIKVVQEIGRILKPGGKLILTAPLGSGIHQEPYHFYGGYTPYWYEKFLPEAGLGEIAIEPNGGTFKHYGQQSFNLVKNMAPWNLNANFLVRIAYSFLWLIALPWLTLVFPFFCHWLDRFDKNKQFTIGYHVTAKKTGSL